MKPAFVLGIVILAVGAQAQDSTGILGGALDSHLPTTSSSEPKVDISSQTGSETSLEGDTLDSESSTLLGSNPLTPSEPMGSSSPFGSTGTTLRATPAPTLGPPPTTPEPAAYLTAGFGLLGLVSLRRKRSR